MISSDRRATIALSRLLPRLEAAFPSDVDTPVWSEFTSRLNSHFDTLFALLLQLYGDQYDFFYHLETLLLSMARMWLDRPPDLRRLDIQREQNPQWFQSQHMVGGVCYVDLFAGDLERLNDRIPYFQELGLTYLHLMPLFKAPSGNSDGGYAVSSYREVDPQLGTMAQLNHLAENLRRAGISLVLDFVFNHTSDDHQWAQEAQSGHSESSDFYFIFPDRTVPDTFQPFLRDIFPDQRPGSFTYRPDLDRWVWTTFNSFQWDLNYRNPALFVRMAEEMLFLANQGAEILRLDAVAFAWKTAGTSCEGLPQVHLLVRAFNAVARIAAPALLFKSEAIVHPDEVVRYIHPDECQLSYNPLLMALLWEALATRDVKLLRHSLAHRFSINPSCSWVNYVRSHDDIGWTFDDGDAANLGINGYDHRRFLNAFYTNRFPGSFARGVPFGENVHTGDARIAGSCASLSGLEGALQDGGQVEIDHAVRRILLLYGIIFSIGGIPLIYLGDEIGTLNNYDYLDDPAKIADSRWVHRSAVNRALMEQRHDPLSIPGRIFSSLHHLLELRVSHPTLADGEMVVLDIPHQHVFGYVRHHQEPWIVVLANFSEREQQIFSTAVAGYLRGVWTDLITGQTVAAGDTISLEPYQLVWLQGE